MGGIYPLDSEKNLILYPSQNTLYLRTVFGENFTRPVTLCTDYEKSLSDTIHNSTIYYSYQNTAGDIIVRSITDLQELYRISSAKSPNCKNPLLLSFQETLLLFYVIQNPIGNNFYLKALYPFHPEKHIAVLDKSFRKSPAIFALPSNQGILICAYTDDTQCVLYMDNNFNCHDISRTDNSDDKIDKAVLLKNVEQLQKELHERDAIIESIKRQYAELMDTASKYKAEAEKWHDLAYKKDARPVPGERLLSDEW